MNTPESEAAPQPAPGLQVEVDSPSARQPGRRWLAIFLASIAVAALGTTVLLGQRGSPAPQPRIAWSENQLETILSPGETAARYLTFTSSLDVQNIVLDPVPELAPFVTISPSTFASVPANTLQSVQVNFAIPAGATLGTYDGTIHVRLGNQTLPQTLKVMVTNWQSFVDSDANLSLKYPPGWTTAVPESGLFVLYPPETRLGEESAHIAITIRPNPERKAVLAFYDGGDARDLVGQSDGVYTTGSIDGFTYYDFSPSLSFAGERIVVVQRLDDFVEIADNGAAFQDGGQAFSRLLSSIHLQ